VAEDSIQVCSPSMYREFCVPYDDLQYQAFGSGLPGGRGMHMCGDSRHLLDALVPFSAGQLRQVRDYDAGP
jgi:hypothetical protein